MTLVSVMLFFSTVTCCAKTRITNLRTYIIHVNIMVVEVEKQAKQTVNHACIDTIL